MARVEIRHRDGLWADLEIANEGDEAVSIHDPGNPLPTGGWEASRAAYTVAVLLSFHFLKLALSNGSGVPAERTGLATLSDHEVGPPLALAPAEVLTIPIPLHELFVLEEGETYRLDVDYGDDGLRVHATARFRFAR